MAKAELEITEMICLLWCKERVCRNKAGWNKPCQWLPFQTGRIVTDGQVSLKCSFSVLLCQFLRVNVVGGGVLHILVLVGLSKSISHPLLRSPKTNWPKNEGYFQRIAF